MSELLRSVPGPIFLLLFWGAWFVLHRLMRRFEDPEGPIGSGADPLSLPPRQVALLVQGQGVALLAVVYELLHQGKLAWADAAQTLLETAREARSDEPLEAVVLVCAKRPQAVRSLVGQVRVSAAGLLEQDRRRLEARGLLVSSQAVAGAWGRISIPLSIVGFLAVSKLRIGMEHGRPVFLLVISLFVASVLLLSLHQPWGAMRRTRKGNALVARARQHVQNATMGQQEPLHGERMLALGVLGVAALATDPLALGLQHGAWSVGGESSHDSGSASFGWSSSDSGDGGSGGSDGGDGGGNGDSGGGGGCGGCGGGD